MKVRGRRFRRLEVYQFKSFTLGTVHREPIYCLPTDYITRNQTTVHLEEENKLLVIYCRGTDGSLICRDCFAAVSGKAQNEVARR